MIGNFLKWFITCGIIAFVLFFIAAVSDGTFGSLGLVGGVQSCLVGAAGVSLTIYIVKEVAQLSIRLLGRVFHYFG